MIVNAIVCHILQCLTWSLHPNCPESDVKAFGVEASPFPYSGVEASQEFPYSGVNASPHISSLRLPSIFIARRMYAPLHVRCEGRAMKIKNKLATLMKMEKANTPKTDKGDTPTPKNNSDTQTRATKALHQNKRTRQHRPGKSV